MYTQLIIFTVIAVARGDEPWRGPLADHVIGQLVQETPEVAAARRQHEATYSKVRAILPELPPEKDEHVVPQVFGFPQPVHTHFPVVTPPPSPVIIDGELKPRWTGPLADHKLGQLVPETPEVAAARKHHENVFAKVRATLPELPPEKIELGQDPLLYTQVHHHIPQVHQPTSRPQVLNFATAEEVEAARVAHMQAVMERLVLLEKLRVGVPVTPPSTTTPVPAPVQPLVFQWGSVIDTPEVAAAKAEHARALAAVLGH